MEKAVTNLWLACAETMRAIAREVGEDRKAFGRHEMVGYLLTEPSPSWQACVILFGDKTRGGKGWAKRLSESSEATPETDRSTYWRWMRWSVMLHIETRSYKSAHKLLHKGLDSHQVKPLLGRISAQGKYEREEFRTDAENEPIEYLRLLEQAVQLQILIFGTSGRVKPSKGEGKAHFRNKLRQELKRADEMIRRGLRLAASIRDHDHSTTSPSASQAIWCEVRLLTHLSLVHARANSVGYLPRHYRDPLGILSDAEAKLRAANPQRTRAELALIDLYRADAKLSAEPCALVGNDLFLLLRGEEPQNIRTRKHLGREASACATDAIRFLDRAQGVMRDRRRNVWWTAWYFERKLRAIACAVLASCPNQMPPRAGPIPYLGLEAAMRLSETEADRLLNDAQRMIRVDAYRLATILEAYVLCLLALVHRIAKDQDAPRLEHRISAMEKRIGEVHAVLKEVYRARLDGSGAISSEVDEYIKAVMGSEHHGGKIKEALSSSLYKTKRDSATGQVLSDHEFNALCAGLTSYGS